MAGLGRLATRGASVTLAAQGIRFVLQIAALAILTRLLSPQEFGLVAMVTAVLGVAEIVRDFGLSSAAIQARTVSTEERTNLFWLNVGMGTVCALVAAALAPVLAHVYAQPEVQGITLALAGLFIVSGANTQYRADLSRALRFRALALTDVVAAILSITVGILAAARGAGYWAVVLQQATFVVVTFAVNFAQCRWLPGRPHRQVSVRPFAKFGAHLLGTNLMGYTVNNLDNVAIGIVWGSGPLGLYSRAYQLLQVPLQQVNAPLGRVVLPILSRAQDDPEAYVRFFRRYQLSLCYSLGVGFGLLAGVSAPVVQLLFGPDWGGVTPILFALALSGVFKGIDSANYQLWVSRGLTAQLLKFYALSRPLLILVILAGLPWGPVGVAYGQLVGAVLHFGVGLGIVCRLAGIAYRPLLAQSLRTLLLVIAPAATLAGLAAHAFVDPWIGLVAGLAAGAIWIGLVITVVPPVRRDVTPLLKVLRQAVRQKA